MKNLCEGIQNVVWEKAPDYWQGCYLFWPKFRPDGIKRKRLTCPKCGRRVYSSVAIDHDGDYIFHSLPPHKPKHWWKGKTHKQTKGK